MKSYYSLITLVLFTVFCSHYSYAQKIKIESDTIKVDEQAYAIMKKKTVGMLRYDYIVMGLSGTELIYLKSKTRPFNGGFRYGPSEELYFDVNFIATGSKAEINYQNTNKVTRLIVENNLVRGNYVDPESEKRFILLYNGYMASSTSAITETAPAVVVNINNNTGNTAENNAPANVPPRSKSPVSIEGNKIIRDEEVIGKFRQDTTTSNYSQKSLIITIYSEAGEKIADASVPVINPQEWVINIIGENKSYNLMYDTPGEKENLFRWLADKNYLTY